MINALKQPKLFFLLALSVLFIGLDQWTKAFASSHLMYAIAEPVLPFLNWTLLHNEGAAFSFLSNAGGWQRWFFVAVSAIASVVFFIWLLRTPTKQGLMRYCLTFIVAGAIGNLIDRVQLGYVVDFISVHWQNTYYFPAFNLADSFITCGAILMVLEMFLHSEQTRD